MSDDEIEDIIERIISAYRQDWSDGTRAIWIEKLDACGCTHQQCREALQLMLDDTDFPVWSRLYRHLEKYVLRNRDERQSRLRAAEKRQWQLADQRAEQEQIPAEVDRYVAEVVARIEAKASEQWRRAKRIEAAEPLTMRDVEERKRMLRAQLEALEKRESEGQV